MAIPVASLSPFLAQSFLAVCFLFRVKFGAFGHPPVCVFEKGRDPRRGLDFDMYIHTGRVFACSVRNNSPTIDLRF
ncbi:hypothetical protein EV363DRAFT_1353249 [Boletus edulis]|nr:hypothetical protein EV363DRAFT_1353249 [Boletus edulis]